VGVSAAATRLSIARPDRRVDPSSRLTPPSSDPAPTLRPTGEKSVRFETFLPIPFPVFHLHQLERPTPRSATSAPLTQNPPRLGGARAFST